MTVPFIVCVLFLCFPSLLVTEIMDVVESFLLCVVGMSVLVFLILDVLAFIEKSSKTCVRAFDSGWVVGVGGQRSAVVYDREAEVEEEIPENVEQIAEEEEEKEKGGNPVTVGCTEPGVSVDDCRPNLGVCEDGETGGEDEFIEDWEGIERTELERAFGEAVVFVNSKCGGDRISGAVKSELDGLQRVALEGPCCGSQPMALNIFARSKWKSWQKLGDMTRETAMESYMEILMKGIPKWKCKDNPTIPTQQSCVGYLKLVFDGDNILNI